MNAREKRELLDAIASWEWSQSSSVSEAVGQNNCIRALVSIFKITNEDLLFYRCWYMFEAFYPGQEKDDKFDMFCDWIDEIGYEAATDIAERGSRKTDQYVHAAFDEWRGQK